MCVLSVLYRSALLCCHTAPGYPRALGRVEEAGAKQRGSMLTITDTRLRLNPEFNHRSIGGDDVMVIQKCTGTAKLALASHNSTRACKIGGTAKTSGGRHEYL